MSNSGAIGVFDSGMGGLTVARALQEKLPDEQLVYLGDTARVPYGTRTPETVINYALNNARTLMKHADLKMLVVACNTASAVSIPTLEAELPIPVMGVIKPGARAALQQTHRESRICILGTEGTIRSKAYEKELAGLGHAGEHISIACPLLVPLVEEGLTEGEIVDLVLQRYLGSVHQVDAVILGCTHYPLLKDAISRCFSGDVHVTDGAAATAKEVLQYLSSNNLLAESRSADDVYLFTDSPEKMPTLASLFLGKEIGSHQVQQVDVHT